MALLPLLTFLGMLFGVNDAEIVFAGDAMQHQAQLNAAKRGPEAWDYSECFADVAPGFRPPTLPL